MNPRSLLPRRLLDAARADAIPAGQSGPWTIVKFQTEKPVTHPRPSDGRLFTIPPGNYTNLWRSTEATMHNSCGELVMHDVPHELHTHLQFMLRARGRVLITGLGLGCVARGCLANPAVKHVVVIERDPHVIQLVGVHMLHLPRLTIVLDDALSFCRRHPRRFDCAWHDLWSDPDKEEPHLSVIHSKLFLALRKTIPMQGAWALPRTYRRVVRNKGFGLL